ncbi:MAG TPA: hypothetical protein VGO92_13470 [Acidimicrobiales bacterium]|jgi:hypothetical protein|nr:hypothetical protein [Acidimicrobiales bacterium]
MAGLRTVVTELATGLGMLGLPTLDEALAARPAAMVSMSPAEWDRLAGLHEGGAFAADFAAAWDNGRAFLEARDGLRGRRPLTVEWKGSHKAPGDEAAPVDLRIDHVYLVSGKYESDILHNAAPARLFDKLLTNSPGGRGGNWFAAVAPDEHQALYQTVRTPGLPALVDDLTAAEQRRLGTELRAWPTVAAQEAYRALVAAVAAESAARWREGLKQVRSQQELMLWRLLRIGSAPYFVLGTRKAAGLRIRVATPWDWRQRYALRSFEVAAQPGGQPRVGWRAVVRDRHSGDDAEVRGHVEVRWAHGRFSTAEAKVYLDTPHNDVPGYFPLL